MMIIPRHVHHRTNSMLRRISSLRLFSRPGTEALSASLERAQASSDAVERLKQSIRPLYEHQNEKLKYIKAHDDVPILQVTPKHLLNGMRGVPSLVWDVSSVDAKKGIRYRGIRPDDLIERLPRSKGAREFAGRLSVPSLIAEVPSVEALFWLLVTGAMPTKEDEDVLKMAMVTAVPFDSICDTVCKTIDNAPASLHPMTLFTIGILSAQHTSSFSNAYVTGVATKTNLWEFALADAVKLLAHLPIIAAYVYRKLYQPDKLKSFRDEVTATSTEDVDWASRFSLLIGGTDPMVHDLLRLYILLHADHEGGNASAHTANIVSSAHADPFLAFGAAMCGLAGPLHGLANQDCLRWLLQLKKILDDSNFDYSDDAALRAAIAAYAEKEFESGKVIPGYGHAVLRTVDPRFLALKRWGQKNAADDPLIKLNLVCSEVVQEVLSRKPKVSNPHPNVDCGSGTALYYCGVREPEFFTVLFGLSRSVGILASIVWARIFKCPLERPKSLTVDGLQRAIDKQLKKHVSDSSP
eukprot:Gregarina_sp_Pseudo_9__316@NODE_1204_length_1781_cov_34_200918_g1130_i0_p1_GENE_NODE_1204_length_1781_cov_34_200918_g1130_i0NODE_1204_length_1781_cov_34_200918_g1130_i0_p1_ORF_typecomplete_len524_score92_13Citrate_synt/PF00285_21/1_3e62_NODE_1204_length_1781_cov_34_200918_g1130_i01031674